MKCYIIKGYTGSYDDAVDWIVAIYTLEDTAVAHLNILEAWYKKEHAIMTNRGTYPYSVETKCPYDSCFRDDDGVSYNIQVEEILDLTREQLNEKFFVDAL